MSELNKAPRNRILDIMRLLFASLVLLSHAPELTDGNQSRELFTRAFHDGSTFGGIAVVGFFLLSGFLILHSWINAPSALDYLRKRTLRIVPGYLVAALLSTLLLGQLVPGVPHFFSHLGRPFIKSLVFLSTPATPPVALHAVPAYPFVNGALWTISYEFRCYLLVAVLGVTGALRHRLFWLGLTGLFFFLVLSQGLQGRVIWHGLLLGESAPTFWMAFAFLVGGCFLLYRDHIPFRPSFALLAAAALFVSLLRERTALAGLALFGGYLLFYLARLPHRWVRSLGNFPDISYGVYLYGWPVEVLLICAIRNSPWLVFFLALPVCAAIGWLSWHFVERPMLGLGRHHTAKVP